MTTKRNPQHQNVVLERIEPASEGDGFPRYRIVAKRIESLDLAEKAAKKLATDQPGHVFTVARTWPPVLAQVKTEVRYVNPDSEGQSDAPQAANEPAKTPVKDAKPTEASSTPDVGELF